MHMTPPASEQQTITRKDTCKRRIEGGSPPLFVEVVDVLIEDELLRVDVLGGVRDGEIRQRGGRGAHAIGVAAVEQVVPAATGLALLACTNKPPKSAPKSPIRTSTLP